MNETTIVETTTTKNPLIRKAVILTGAAVGIIIAGGLVLFKKDTSGEDEDAEVIDLDSAR